MERAVPMAPSLRGHGRYYPGVRQYSSVSYQSLIYAAALLIPEHSHPMRSPLSRLYKVRVLPHTHPVSRAIVF